MAWLVQPIDTATETSVFLRRRAQSCLRLAQESRQAAVVAELLTLAACLHERATHVGREPAQQAVQQALLRALI